MTQDHIQNMLDELETPRKVLTKWEESFLESITEQYQWRKTLTERQLETLKRIHSEKMR